MDSKNLQNKLLVKYYLQARMKLWMILSIFFIFNLVSIQNFIFINNLE